jgi:ABC-type transport system substrate-binding protein
MFNKFLSFSFSLTAVVLLTACGGSSDPEPEALPATVVRDLAADPSTIDPLTGPRPGTGRFTFFSLRTGAVVPNTDSLTTNWDLGFRGTTIIVNGGTIRRGNAGVVIRQGLFDEVNEAPETGFAQDNAPPISFAIPNTAGNGWYNYDAPRNLIIPIAGRVFIIRTAEGKFAKLEILSYYRGAPAVLDANSVSRHYTFRYVFQPDGSRNISSKK